MGLKISVLEEAKTGVRAYPRQTTLLFVCDGDHGLFTKPQRLDIEGSYIEQHARMITAGWSETPERILCPSCSGKRSRTKS
jgi:hypothetical protein